MTQNASADGQPAAPAGTPQPPVAPAPTAPPPAAAQGPPPWWAQPPKKTSWGKRIAKSIFGLLFILSVLVNIELFLLLTASSRGGFDMTVIEKGEDDQEVAVYTVAGLIDGKASATFGKFTRLVRDDENIKAVVLRIDSGGGGVAASDEIYMMVKSIREDLNRPVVVSMGATAASGGYYIAAPADEIYAEPTTITGSIGVIAAWPVLKGFLDKHGVEIVTIRSTGAEHWKARENFWEVPDQRVRDNLRVLLNQMQARFEKAVKDGRGGKLKINKVETQVKDADGKIVKVTTTVPFDGQVWVADEAKKLGLVDKIGYTHDAVDAAAKLARLSKPKAVHYAPSKPLMASLMGAEATPGVHIDADLLDRIQTPRIMMLWKVE